MNVLNTLENNTTLGWKGLQGKIAQAYLRKNFFLS
jgi:hypothetical protein